MKRMGSTKSQYFLPSLKLSTPPFAPKMRIFCITIWLVCTTSVANVAQRSSSFQTKKKLTPWSTGKDTSTCLFWTKLEKSEKNCFSYKGNTCDRAVFLLSSPAERLSLPFLQGQMAKRGIQQSCQQPSP